MGLRTTHPNPLNTHLPTHLDRVVGGPQGDEKGHHVPILLPRCAFETCMGVSGHTAQNQSTKEPIQSTPTPTRSKSQQQPTRNKNKTIHPRDRPPTYPRRAAACRPWRGCVRWGRRHAQGGRRPPGACSHGRSGVRGCPHPVVVFCWGGGSVRGGGGVSMYARMGMYMT
jgi:hypothetical protein